MLSLLLPALRSPHHAAQTPLMGFGGLLKAKEGEAPGLDDGLDSADVRGRRARPGVPTLWGGDRGLRAARCPQLWLCG